MSRIFQRQITVQSTHNTVRLQIPDCQALNQRALHTSYLTILQTKECNTQGIGISPYRTVINLFHSILFGIITWSRSQIIPIISTTLDGSCCSNWCRPAISQQNHVEYIFTVKAPSGEYKSDLYINPTVGTTSPLDFHACALKNVLSTLAKATGMHEATKKSANIIISLINKINIMRWDNWVEIISLVQLIVFLFFQSLPIRDTKLSNEKFSGTMTLGCP